MYFLAICRIKFLILGKCFGLFTELKEIECAVIKFVIISDNFEPFIENSGDPLVVNFTCFGGF